MYRLEIYNEKKEKTLNITGKFSRIYETSSYMFILYYNDKIMDGELQIDGVENENGSYRNVSLNKLNIRPFLNCLGIFTLSYNDIKISEVDVATRKINSRDANDLFKFVYNKGHNLFNLYINKQRNYSSYRGQKATFPLLNYISIIKEILITFRKLYPSFSIKPLYRLRTQIVEVDYKEKDITDKSIEWILNNLDSINYGQELKQIPGSFRIENTYAIPQKIVSESNVKDFNIYENKILLGVIHSIGFHLQQITNMANDFLDDDNNLDSDFASFDSIKKTILKSELDNFYEVKKIYASVRKSYKRLFHNIKPIHEKPKLTHNFKKERHYFELFNKIQLFYKSTLNSNGLRIALGIKNLDILYELYNLYKIIDIFIAKIGEPIEIYSNDNLNIDYITFKKNNETYRIYYQLKIMKLDSKPQYSWIKLFNNSSVNNYYTPDIVIEKESNKTYNYAILDAKYSTKKWVSSKGKNIGETAQKIIGKYYYSISFRNEKYKKSDYILLLYPGNSKNNFFTTNFNYLPIIGAVPSITSNEKELHNIIEAMINKWK